MSTTVYLEYEGFNSETNLLIKKIGRRFGGSVSGSGFDLLNGIRDISVEFKTEKDAISAAEVILSNIESVSCEFYNYEEK